MGRPCPCSCACSIATEYYYCHLNKRALIRGQWWLEMENGSAPSVTVRRRALATPSLPPWNGDCLFLLSVVVSLGTVLSLRQRNQVAAVLLSDQNNKQLLWFAPRHYYYAQTQIERSGAKKKIAHSQAVLPPSRFHFIITLGFSPFSFNIISTRAHFTGYCFWYRRQKEKTRQTPTILVVSLAED